MPRPRAATERACFTMRSDQLEGLRRISRETGAPVAELTRRAVDAFLAGTVAGDVLADLVPGEDELARLTVGA